MVPERQISNCADGRKGMGVGLNRDEPLISVIVPVYNGQDYLTGCIESIENQTYGHLEIIIVNDGSTDRTAAICDRLRESYRNVQILHLDDKGVSAARNVGIEAAAGEFITFVDADDRILPDMIRVLYNGIVETQSDAAGCKFFMWSSEEAWAARKEQTETDVSRADRTAGEIKRYAARTYLREELLCGNSRCWSKLYRREITEQVRFRENLTIGEDMLFLVQLLPHINTIAETTYSGYGYYQNPAGAINRKFTPHYMDQITCWRLAREEILRMDRELDAQVTALWMMGIMLTAGKLAGLDAAKRRVNEKYIGICRENLREAMKIPGAYRRLSAGYRIKTMMFRILPHLYLSLYYLNLRGKSRN